MVALALNDLQNDIDGSCAWSRDNNVLFAPEKCEVLHFGRNNPWHQYLIDGEEIKSSATVKDLGIYFSSDLSFTHHCEYLAASAGVVLRRLRRCFGLTTKEMFLPLYKTFIRSKLEYASTVWSPYQVKDINTIEKVQRRATKLVRNISHLSYEARLDYLGLQTLRTRRIRQDLISIYMLIHGILKFDYSDWFILVGETRLRRHSYYLRTNIKTSHLDRCHYTFQHRVITNWNNLSQYVVDAPSIKSFKSRLHASGFLDDV